MDESILQAFAALISIGGLIVACWAVYALSVRTNRHNEFQREVNRVRVKRMEAEAKLDLKLREWQQTKSLEDLERHRRRLEGELDSLHEEQDEAVGGANGVLRLPSSEDAPKKRRKLP